MLIVMQDPSAKKNVTSLAEHILSQTSHQIEKKWSVTAVLPSCTNPMTSWRHFSKLFKGDRGKKKRKKEKRKRRWCSSEEKKRKKKKKKRWYSRHGSFDCFVYLDTSVIQYVLQSVLLIVSWSTFVLVCMFVRAHAGVHASVSVCGFSVFVCVCVVVFLPLSLCSCHSILPRWRLLLYMGMWWNSVHSLKHTYITYI